MDYATLAGIGSIVLLGLWALLGGANGDIGAFWNLPGMLLVLGGAIAATLTSFTLAQLRVVRGMLRKAFVEEVDSPHATIAELLKLADVARRDGILALDAELPPEDDRYLARAVRMIVDGYEPSVIESRLTDELEATDARHASGRQFLDLLGRYCPAFGMAGTLIGLVLMLRNMSDPTRIGPGMAVALLTTLYGLIFANGVFLPLSQKLANRDTGEFLIKTIVLKGVLAIQAGDNPRVVEQKLLAFLPASECRAMPGRLLVAGSPAAANARGRVRVGGAAA